MCFVLLSWCDSAKRCVYKIIFSVIWVFFFLNSLWYQKQHPWEMAKKSSSRLLVAMTYGSRNLLSSGLSVPTEVCSYVFLLSHFTSVLVLTCPSSLILPMSSFMDTRYRRTEPSKGLSSTFIFTAVDRMLSSHWLSKPRVKVGALSFLYPCILTSVKN